MIFHLCTELRRSSEGLSYDPNSSFLTETELVIIKNQIKKNSKIIDEYLSKIDLLINYEGHYQHEDFVRRLRKRMFLLMEENDTFRNVLWRHYKEEACRQYSKISHID